MPRSPWRWSLTSFALRASAPGMVWLLLESKRPGEGFTQALVYEPFLWLLAYTVTSTSTTYLLARRADRVPIWTNDSLIGALLAIDLSALGLMWALGEMGSPVARMVPLLPPILGAVLLWRRKAPLAPNERR